MDAQELLRPRMGTKKGPKALSTQLRPGRDLSSIGLGRRTEPALLSPQRLPHLIARDAEPVGDGGLAMA